MSLYTECTMCGELTDQCVENPMLAYEEGDFSEHFICEECLSELNRELRDVIRALSMPTDREYL